MPSMTVATSECIGLIEATTFGGFSVAPTGPDRTTAVAIDTRDRTAGFTVHTLSEL